MKNTIQVKITMPFILSLVIVLGISCEYQEVADADYPEEMIFMPAAGQGIYYVDTMQYQTEFLPTQGSPYRYIINLDDNEFIIPLGVYRSGVSKEKSCLINTYVDKDTIQNLIVSGSFAETSLLPDEEYSMEESLQLKSDQDFATFNLTINYDFLKENPDSVFSIAVGIDSDDIKINRELSLTLIKIFSRSAILTK